MLRHLYAFLLSLCALCACVGTPHRDPSEVSQLEVGAYKRGVEAGCINAGRSKGDPEEKTNAFCKCVIATLESRLSSEEWRTATFYAQQRRSADEQRTLAPHMLAVQQCRASP
jgi:hypothetical protein